MIFVLYILIAIIVFITLLLFLRKNNTISLEQSKKLNETQNSHYFEFSKQQFHYVEKGQGELIVLVHGIGDSFYVFNNLADLLAKKYHVICIDLPGFGLSEVPNSFGANNNVIQFYRDFMNAFLTHKNVKDFHLAGNSLGGLVSWDWAVNNSTFNLKSLCLIASAGFDMATVRKNVSKGILDKLPAIILKKGAPLKISEISASTCIVDKTKIDKAFIKAHSSMLNKEGTIPFFIKLLFNAFEPEIEKLEKLEVPTLIAWGKKDKIIPMNHAYEFQKVIHNSEVVVYDNVGHYPQVENYSNFAKDYLYFLSKI